MKTPTSALPSILRFICVTALIVLIGTITGWSETWPVPFPAPDSGLQLSLTTNTYRVYAGDPVATPVIRFSTSFPGYQLRDSVLASVQLLNRSATDLTFSFSDAAASLRHFNFRVLNSAGDEVWNSVEADTAGVVDVPATGVLKKRTRWSSTVRIPLKVAAVWLPAGVYTVEAAIAGEPKIGATALFEVVTTPAPPPEIPPNTGIKGQVLRDHGSFVQLDGTVIAPTALPSGTKAVLDIQQIIPPNVRLSRPPFAWHGETAADGSFQVPTPEGQYRVTATTGGGPGQPPLYKTGVFWVFAPKPPATSASVDTTVSTGQFSSVTLLLSGEIQYEQPHADTGIQGQVYYPATTGDIGKVGAYVWVVVEEIPVSSDSTGPEIRLRPLFRMGRSTDSEGRFQVNTPPGHFRVTATQFPLGTTNTLSAFQDSDVVAVFMLPSGSAEATVTAGHLTDVTIQMKLAPVPSTELKTVWLVSTVDVQELLTLVAPTMLQVTAKGSVTTGGWSQPQLKLRGVTTDGVIEFDFVAKPPDGIATQVISPITATTQVAKPAKFTGIRVYAQSNTKELTIATVLTN